jgi:hypothetical protein
MNLYDVNNYSMANRMFISTYFFRYEPPCTPTYYGRIVVKTLYTPAPIKNCAEFKNVCIHQCVQTCVYMYIVRTRFYANFYIVSKRKHNAQFSLKGLKKMFQCKQKMFASDLIKIVKMFI